MIHFRGIKKKNKNKNTNISITYLHEVVNFILSHFYLLSFSFVCYNFLLGN